MSNQCDLFCTPGRTVWEVRWIETNWMCRIGGWEMVHLREVVWLGIEPKSKRLAQARESIDLKLEVMRNGRRVVVLKRNMLIDWQSVFFLRNLEIIHPQVLNFYYSSLKLPLGVSGWVRHEDVPGIADHHRWLWYATPAQVKSKFSMLGTCKPKWNGRFGTRKKTDETRQNWPILRVKVL